MADRFTELLPSIAIERPTLWAVTYGGEYRINNPGEDGHIMDGTGGSPDLLGTLLAGDAAMRKVLGK